MEETHDSECVRGCVGKVSDKKLCVICSESYASCDRLLQWIHLQETARWAIRTSSGRQKSSFAAAQVAVSKERSRPAGASGEQNVLYL